MPKRTDIKKILLIGAGPIVIGQACEFDYSGTQAVKALKEEGFEVILVNSNPATIMTDPVFADRTYIEPVTPEFVEKIIEKERPDALLPTMGGQTALNVAKALAESGVLEKYGVELIGAKLEAINKAEDRNLFREAMIRIGLDVPKSGLAHNLEDSIRIGEEIGFPIISRPAFTLGGTGGGIAYNMEELKDLARRGLDASPVSQILLEESIIGWKEFELEVMRDTADNVVIICSIENLDPMGIHTGDSITVAPAQTLTDKEYQHMRDAAIKIMREIGVDTGGSNVQFGLNPKNGRLVIIEMNPRVSRSSALASKATGFPIAKIAAKLSVGYTLDEIPNDITKKTPASFEPTIDYVVTKVPRWAFEKFPGADETLNTQMKSVGEVMAIGRTFKESLQKALRSLETGRFGFGNDGKDPLASLEQIEEKLKVPNRDRIFYIFSAFGAGMSLEKIHQLTHIDLWFLDNLHQIYRLGETLKSDTLSTVSAELLKMAKEQGYSNVQLAHLLKSSPEAVTERLAKEKIRVTFKTVDTCSAEFEAHTPYHYSTFESEDEVAPSDRKKIMILGGGPNRIGQGIEFDYCCVHASFALREDGFETIMVNSNPETVSTDYDTSDRLYFEPLTQEDVLNIYEKEKPWGVIVQFGGQTPLKLAQGLKKAGLPIIGTSPESIDVAEDRELFSALLKKLDIPQPSNGTARSTDEALAVAREIGYPVVVRPSYVLGGRAMEIVYDDSELMRYMTHAVQASPEHPILVDKFLENALEVDVDAIADGELVVIGGIMEHIEQAGIHSGDSACILPAQSLSAALLKDIRDYTVRMANELNVVGLMNVQYAIKDEKVYVLEVNPRASRTVPFVSKAIGVPLAKLAARVMSGKKLKELGFTREIIPSYISVKEAVLPFNKFPGTDIILGPEMRSTGEVMGIADNFGEAFAKAQFGASQRLPREGRVFVSVNDRDKPSIYPVAKGLIELGYTVVATAGTYQYLTSKGLKVEKTFKVQEAERPNIVDEMINKRIQLIINTPVGKGAHIDDKYIRRTAITYAIPVVTTVAGAAATVEALKALKQGKVGVKPLQDYHKV